MHLPNGFPGAMPPGANGRRNADGAEAGSCGSPASSDAVLGGGAALGAEVSMRDVLAEARSN